MFSGYLLAGDKKVVSHSSKFEVRNMKGKLLLSADSDNVYLGAEKLTVAGKSTPQSDIFFLSLSPRYWTGPFVGCLKSNENL